MDTLNEMLSNSNKAEFMETVEERLEHYDKAVIVFVRDGKNFDVDSDTLALNVANLYEALGMLDIAHDDLLLLADEETGDENIPSV